MVMFIFTMFGVQMYFAWGDWNAMGMVFWKIILITTVVGIVLAFIYAPRTWCIRLQDMQVRSNKAADLLLPDDDETALLT